VVPLAGLVPTLSLLVFHIYISFLGLSTFEYLIKARTLREEAELARLEKDPEHQRRLEARRQEQEAVRKQYLKDQAKRKEKNELMKRRGEAKKRAKLPMGVLASVATV